jgi:DNA end-binding protein Ku
MMARSIWRGAISFGLIYIPVELYAASKENSLPLHMLDGRDFSPIGYQRINKSTGEAVDWAHIVKGFEYEKGSYVALSDADFKNANVKATQTIEIASFTDVDHIGAIYFDTPYHLTAERGGQKAYALLSQTLNATRKVAVGSFVMRGREHLCVVMADEDRLMLVTLRFADEILPPTTREGDSADQGSTTRRISATELSMAKRLVEGMSGPFKPAQFKDTYRLDLMKRIREKIRKRETHTLAADASAPTDLRPKADVIDLMDALKKSLDARGAQRARRVPKRASPRGGRG